MHDPLSLVKTLTTSGLETPELRLMLETSRHPDRSLWLAVHYGSYLFPLIVQPKIKYLTVKTLISQLKLTKNHASKKQLTYGKPGDRVSFFPSNMVQEGQR